jgi:hypothetical protein
MMQLGIALSHAVFLMVSFIHHEDSNRISFVFMVNHGKT